MKFKIIGILLGISSFVWGATLPSGMSLVEIEDTVKRLGPGGATRLLRSAEPYPLWPGFKGGFELAFAPTGKVNSFGADDGSISSLLFIPRLYLAKGLFLNTEVILSWLPGGTLNTLSTFGIVLKWTFLPERRYKRGSVAAFISYTSLAGLERYEGEDYELGVIASRDWVGIRPFLGLGLLFARGKVADSVDPNYVGAHNTLHAFVGFEWETPVNITAQLDFMNLSIMGTLSLAKKF